MSFILTLLVAHYGKSSEEFAPVVDTLISIILYKVVLRKSKSNLNWATQNILLNRRMQV